MRDLDPDDERPPYLQLADVLRAAVSSGEIQPGEMIPSRAELHERYGLAGATITAAIRVLRDEGVLVARQGSGVSVRRVPQPEAADVQTQLAELRARVERLERMLEDQ